MAEAGGKQTTKVEVINSVSTALQAMAAVIGIGLALYAAFFTTLPELLEKQLRSEVVASNEEIADLRRTRNNLEAQQEALATSNKALSAQNETIAQNAKSLRDKVEELGTQGRTLAAANQDLIAQQKALQLETDQLTTSRDDLRQQVASLKVEREAYAKDALDVAWSRVSAQANYELDIMQGVATVCSRYDEHLKWLKGAEAGRPTDPPKGLWTGVPEQPNLNPGGHSFAVGALVAGFINAIGSPSAARRFEKASNEWLDAHTLAGKGATKVSGADFVTHINGYPFLEVLLPAEHQLIEAELAGFLKAHPDLGALQLNVVFDGPAPVQARIESGRLSQSNLAKFRAEFRNFLKAKGAKEDPVETSNADK